MKIPEFTIFYKLGSKFIEGYRDRCRERQAVFDTSIVVSNEIQLKDCLPLSDHLSHGTFNEVCRLLSRKKYNFAAAKVGAYALLPDDPRSKLCLQVIKTGIFILAKAGPGGIAVGTLNLICERYGYFI
jgi:hypothetical protein